MRDLTQRILALGVQNVVFLVPMRPLRTLMFIKYKSSSDAKVIVPCVIDERKDKVEDNYKIELRAIYKDFGKERFYISDLESILSHNSDFRMLADLSKFTKEELLTSDDPTLRGLAMKGADEQDW